ARPFRFSRQGHQPGRRGHTCYLLRRRHGPAARRLHPVRAMLFPVKRSIPSLVFVALTCVAPSAIAQSPAPQPVPALPGQTASGPSDAAPASPSALPTPQQLYEHVRRGVAVIERGGLPVAIGTVLGNDGRILTALSGLGGGDSADVLYADGTTVH